MHCHESPFHPIDVATLRPTPEAAYELANLPNPALWALTGGWTLWSLPVPQVLAIYGLIIPQGQAVAYGFLLCSRLAVRHPLPVVRAVRRTMAREAQHHELTAIYAETRADWVTGRRFLEVCGFKAGTVFFPDGPKAEMYVQYEWTPQGEAI